jgi:hypothetical protein
VNIKKTFHSCYKKFRVTAFANGRSEESRSMMQSHYQLTPGADLPALLAARGTINRWNGSSINSYFYDCTPTDTTYGCDNGAENYSIDPFEISGIASGGFNEISDMSGTPTVVSTTYDSSLDPSGQSIGGTIGSPTVWNSGTGVGVKSPGSEAISYTEDEFFEQYFGTDDRDYIYDQATITAASADFSSTDLDLTPSDTTDKEIIVFEGDVTLDGIQNLSALGNPNAILIIKGDLIMGNPSGAPSAITAGLNAALIYVEGDFKANGAQRIDSLLAVEGNMDIKNALAMYPKENPEQWLADYRGVERGRVSWNENEFHF